MPNLNWPAECTTTDRIQSDAAFVCCACEAARFLWWRISKGAINSPWSSVLYGLYWFIDGTQRHQGEVPCYSDFLITQCRIGGRKPPRQKSAQSAVLVEHRLVTDRQIKGHSIYHACIVSHSITAIKQLTSDDMPLFEPYHNTKSTIQLENKLPSIEFRWTALA